MLHSDLIFAPGVLADLIAFFRGHYSTNSYQLSVTSDPHQLPGLSAHCWSVHCWSVHCSEALLDFAEIAQLEAWLQAQSESNDQN